MAGLDGSESSVSRNNQTSCYKTTERDILLILFFILLYVLVIQSQFTIVRFNLYTVISNNYQPEI